MVMPIHTLITLTLILLPSLATAGPFNDSSLPPLDPGSCPAIQVCDNRGCSETPNDGSIKNIDFHGVRIPDFKTNFPLINAGLSFLKRFHSEEFLLTALQTICKPRNSAPVTCENGIVSGQRPGTAVDFEVLDVWASVGFVPDAKSESPAARQLESCREYARIGRNVADALLPEVALQSNSYSEDGIRIRVNLMKLFSFNPVIEGNCQQMSEPGLVAEKQCTGLHAYFDDLKFALLLGDKLASDGKTAKAWDLVRATDRSIFLLAALAVATPRTGKDGKQPFALALARLMTDDWTALRTAIQKAL